MAHGLGWQEQALCGRLSRPEAVRLFFNPGQPPRRAREMCAACPVIEQCRAWGDDLEDHQITRGHLCGFLAGETTTDRAERRRAELAPAASTPAAFTGGRTSEPLQADKSDLTGPSSAATAPTGRTCAAGASNVQEVHAC